MKQEYKGLLTGSKGQSVEQIKNNYKEKMRELLPEQFEDEKSLQQMIEEKMERAKREHAASRTLSISQFWYGQWRALQWVLEEIKKDDSV
jgi:hypothetical protein